MVMHANALGSSLVSSETDWTDPKRVRRVTGAVRFWGAGQGRAVPFLLLQVMGDPSISTVTFKPASGNYSYKYKPFSGTRGTNGTVPCGK